MHKSAELKQAICTAVNLIYQCKDAGLLKDGGVMTDKFVKDIVELCEIKYENSDIAGLRVAQEACAIYDRDRMKRSSFFKETKPTWSVQGISDQGTKSETFRSMPKLPKDFLVTKHDESCSFGRKLYNFVSNKKILI